MSEKTKKILVIIILIIALYNFGISIAIILKGGRIANYVILIVCLTVIVICSLLIEKLFRKK